MLYLTATVYFPFVAVQSSLLLLCSTPRTRFNPSPLPRRYCLLMLHFGLSSASTHHQLSPHPPACRGSICEHGWVQGYVVGPNPDLWATFLSQEKLQTQRPGENWLAERMDGFASLEKGGEERKRTEREINSTPTPGIHSHNLRVGIFCFCFLGVSLHPMIHLPSPQLQPNRRVPCHRSLFFLFPLLLLFLLFFCCCSPACTDGYPTPRPPASLPRVTFIGNPPNLITLLPGLTHTASIRG